jgi:two-component system, NtrC family, response regulator AtoC
MKPSILVVDDERAFRVLTEETLVAEGFEVRTAPTLARAKAELERALPDLVILDRRLPDGDGITFLKTMSTQHKSGPVVVVVTAHGDVENAVEALRAGAWDYLTKPVQVTDLVVKLRKVLETRGLRDRLALAQSQSSRPPWVEPRSDSRKSPTAAVRQVAQSPDTAVLLCGPSGVGKQYLAEMLHGLTHEDGDAPFVEVNCAALPEELLESELFGHERGAFTNAGATRRGLLEMADGGTLFLDEITEFPASCQAKLLKVLDTMRFRRVGGERELEVRLRVIAATNRDIETAIRGGQLREDLYHRLAVFLVTVPSLAECAEDIPELAKSFLAFFATRMKKPVRAIAPTAMKKLQAYSYPGNIRELRNIIERAVILASGGELTDREIVLPARQDRLDFGDRFFSVAVDAGGDPPTLEQVEREYASRVLDYFEGKRGAAAQALGISYPTFLKRLRELGIE